MAAGEATDEPERDTRLLFLLLAMGVVGVATLGLVPMERMVPEQGLPRIVFLIQPAVLTLAGAVLGWWAAPRAGLGAPVLASLVNGRGIPTGAMRAALPVLAVAIIGTIVLFAYDWQTSEVFAATDMPDIPQPLLARLGYGGIAEEIISRWGILSLVMLGTLKLFASRAVAFWTANLVAALVFAVGHFGLLFSLVPDPPAWLIGAVVLGNLVPGLLFGWLFGRYGLGAAMLAHGGTHLLVWTTAEMLGL